jgi:hypothetical protein
MKELESIDVVQEAIKNLYPHNQQLPVLTAIVRSFAEQLQEVETMLLDIYLKVRLGSATAETLNILGKIVGEYRLGRDDTDYAAAIQGRIKANRSNGRIEDILEALNLTESATYEIEELGNMILMVRQAGVSGIDIDTVNAVLQRARGAGVKAYYQYQYTTDIDTFTHAPGDDDYYAPNGYADDDETGGGAYSDVVE